MTQKNWRKSVVYQIYPKSFYSPEGNATGSIKGVTAKLDYLAELGIEYIWMTPVYQSPQHDNGYDVSDYYAIDPSYGTMEDLDELIREAEARGIGLMMDIVVNHSSTDHEWFQKSLSGDERYRDYYIWRDEPTNWESKFGGNAWEYDEKSRQYYLHLFDVTQADLNWENEQMREDVYEMMRFWREKGIKGFRLDVINLISKEQDFPEDESDGRKFYTDGPRIHEYLKEMNREVFDGHDVITVGEMSSTTLDHCVRYSNPDENELSMTFSFHHLKVDYPNGEKFVAAPFDFIQLKDIMSTWQQGMHGKGWNAIFWCNHDQPRVVSRFGNDTNHRVESAKMLATVLHGLQGTPYIYQGEEIGMTNPGFDDLNEYRDIETLNNYKLKREEGVSHEDMMAAIKQKSRDNSRTPMQWDATIHAGFTDGTPWINVAPNYQDVNVEAALDDPNSVFYHYKNLIALRKELDVLTDGDYTLLTPDSLDVWAYTRKTDREELLVVANFYGTETTYTIPEDFERVSVVSHNYDVPELDGTTLSLRPYEAIMFYKQK
ncbi:alpha,alpha-phosphotrehalase [Exiguobacterium aestuarii]|uniref:Alpha,alpha-phosphotrehalase n=1 Tax=Exiguobacterium aestuarii TaxID=273527 RepID=A0ABW2PIE6_9BACL|nr:MULTISPECIES: alpha,alpha-phosphotrehalase [Exiguobacterium]MCT4786511.1 alpha,alpha-phosphotrehalase [Exiguobacterium aestuarii]